MSNEDLIERAKKRLLLNYKQQPIALVRGEGVYLWDGAGRRYIDMMSLFLPLLITLKLTPTFFRSSEMSIPDIITPMLPVRVPGLATIQSAGQDI